LQKIGIGRYFERLQWVASANVESLLSDFPKADYVN